MKFLIPSNPELKQYVSDKIKIIDDSNYSKIIAINNITKDDIIIIEYPKINLFGEEEIDKGLQTIKKYIETKEDKLYPRDINNFPITNMVKNVHKIIKYADNKLKRFFENYTKKEIEFYYAKYLYNTFEGFNYGPLTLPICAKLNHSCNPNVIFNFNKNNGTMMVKALRNIKRNDEIFGSYLMNKKIDNHKNYLYEHYAFMCNC
jgi:hypothetical protein